nr:hypothetical protein CFP56_22942 [Quercus suber]
MKTQVSDSNKASDDEHRMKAIVTNVYEEPKAATIPTEPTTPIPADHDFMQRLPLGRSTREHFFKLLGCVINHIEHNFVGTVSAERIL